MRRKFRFGRGWFCRRLSISSGRKQTFRVPLRRVRLLNVNSTSLIDKALRSSGSFRSYARTEKYFVKDGLKRTFVISKNALGHRQTIVRERERNIEVNSFATFFIHRYARFAVIDALIRKIYQKTLRCWKINFSASSTV